MADLLQIIIEFLKINCNLVECYPNQPFEAVFYLIFFPSVFILLFIYILTNFILKGEGKPQGLRILVSVAIYMFIVVGGWYSLFIAVSRLWWIIIILLVGFWIFVRNYTGGESQSTGRMGTSALPGIGKYGIEKLKGGGKTNVEKRIADRIKIMKGILKEIKKPKAGTDVGILIARFWQVKEAAESSIEELEAMLGFPAKKVFAKKYWKQIDELTRDFEKEEKEVEKEKRKRYT